MRQLVAGSEQMWCLPARCQRNYQVTLAAEQGTLVLQQPPSLQNHRLWLLRRLRCCLGPVLGQQRLTAGTRAATTRPLTTGHRVRARAAAAAPPCIDQRPNLLRQRAQGRVSWLTILCPVTPAAGLL
jgi:hypothetical protein